MAFDLHDRFGRRFSYLRLSVTEACNFRCTYCLPAGYRKTAPHDFLRVDEIARLTRAFVACGVQKVRITGGEPSIRADLPAIIESLKDAGVTKVALTTNGWALERQLKAWVGAGLTHLNVSVDSLDQQTFARVTGHNRLPQLLRGLDSALQSDLASVKLNAVLLADTLAGGFDAFAELLCTRRISVRFIELMRTGDNAAFFAAQHVPGIVLTDWLTERGWQAQERAGDAGPAVEYSHPEFQGRFGLIAPYAPGFCDSCNRLRVTARGALRLCLFGEGGVSLRDLLQYDVDQSRLQQRIEASLARKARGHGLKDGLFGDARALAQMGG